MMHDQLITSCNKTIFARCPKCHKLLVVYDMHYDINNVFCCHSPLPFKSYLHYGNGGMKE